ncbi:HsdM family class I SAM-dependent methyltransferase [Thermogladius sp. 4427co]|uniref:HsdM family class I SAM-dependent methyltransferase n=1 Tax=Thermogladius sp. 4427co TaxID=3450718 RepID=UPI003F79F0BB
MVVEPYSEFHPETASYILRADPRKRASLGQFFTPRSIREKLLSKLPRLYKPRVLDPACGTGEFLLSAKEYFIEPELHCWEIDPELAEIARKIVPEARVEVVDSLTREFKEEFDIVLGNPPYFEFKPSEEIRSKYREVIYGRVNIYSLFIYLGVRLLKPGGYLAFVVSSSMNNGGYFKKLREFIVRNADIVYLEKIKDPYVFSDPGYRVNHTFQLLVLVKARNTGRYVFSRNGYIVFSERYDYLEKSFEESATLGELGYKVVTGRVVWNQHKDKLTDNPDEGILLVWSHNIRKGRLVLQNKPGKPQYIKWPIEKADRGPVIVVTRVVGHPKHAVVEAALVPPGVVFVAENHVNVVYPPPGASLEELKKVVEELNSERVQKIVRELVGNTQLSKTELENLVPLRIRWVRRLAV